VSGFWQFVIGFAAGGWGVLFICNRYYRREIVKEYLYTELARARLKRAEIEDKIDEIHVRRARR